VLADLGYTGHRGHFGEKTMGEWLRRFPFVGMTFERMVRGVPYTPGKRLLDVGSGSGAFPALMQSQGWHTLALEPDPKAAAVAKHHYGLRVIESPIEDSSLPEGGFDVVTIGHVIEHVQDPIQTLIHCRRALKRDGLLVLVTPNATSYGHRYFGKNWYFSR
jgi:2-polyprenyl-3-methyl-5-hydroxy-6-metoxy-1,4-benzoquinol methylase